MLAISEKEQQLQLIVPSAYPTLKKFFIRQSYKLCVYSLGLIIAWTDRVYQPYGIIVDDSLVVYAEFDEAHKENRHLILPISPERTFSPRELYELAQELGVQSYWFVPDDYIEQFGQEHVGEFFDITEQKGFADYVYLAEDLAQLKGNKYSKKRNLINQFKKTYVNPGRVTVQPITPSDVPECIDFLEKWCKERDCDKDRDGELACEKRAAKNALRHLDVLGFKGLHLRIDGVVNAFGIASQLTSDMGTLHFEKAFASIKGLYQFFDNVCARELFPHMKYINKESDMDMPGLAKAKKSYHPVMMVKSYKMTVR